MPITAKMTEDLNASTKSSFSIMEKLQNEVENNAVKDTIWHYTNYLGLSGIILNGTLLMGDIFKQNDPSEIKFGFSIAADCLGVVARRCNTPFAHQCLRTFTDIHKQLDAATAQYFVFCASNSDNDLEQWRSYGDNGRGFALGFNRRLLVEAMKNSAEEAKCKSMHFSSSYDRGRIEQAAMDVANCLDDCFGTEFPQDLSPEDGKSFTKHLFNNWSVASNYAALFFKHPAYRNESEYRLMVMRGLKEPLVDADGKPLSHFILNWRKHAPTCLTNVRIGPAATKQIAAGLVDALLRSAGTGAGIVHIDQSDIPYRIR